MDWAKLVSLIVRSFFLKAVSQAAKTIRLHSHSYMFSHTQQLNPYSSRAETSRHVRQPAANTQYAYIYVTKVQTKRREERKGEKKRENGEASAKRRTSVRTLFNQLHFLRTYLEDVPKSLQNQRLMCQRRTREMQETEENSRWIKRTVLVDAESANEVTRHGHTILVHRHRHCLCLLYTTVRASTSCLIRV